MVNFAGVNVIKHLAGFAITHHPMVALLLNYANAVSIAEELIDAKRASCPT
ncbi:MAG: hypothetical protein Kow0027_23030 [Saprospiraceae bacterium]